MRPLCLAGGGALMRPLALIAVVVVAALVAVALYVLVTSTL